MLSELGVTADCAPMLDVLHEGAHDIVGDRAIGADPGAVAAIGRALMEGLLDGGALPVIKHIPGHGRARVDSHAELPRVLASREELRASDFAPFRALKDASMAMTAHVVYEAYDRTRPATLSPAVVAEVIRGEIGFDGLLLTDDLKMNAVGGPLPQRAAAALAAGCDIALCCNFTLADKVATAKRVGRLSAKSDARAKRALSLRQQPKDMPADGYARLAALLEDGARAG
jgi:beta-N-acetylhexosaminidase